MEIKDIESAVIYFWDNSKDYLENFGCIIKKYDDKKIKNYTQVAKIYINTQHGGGVGYYINVPKDMEKSLIEKAKIHSKLNSFKKAQE